MVLNHCCSAHRASSSTLHLPLSTPISDCAHYPLPTTSASSSPSPSLSTSASTLYPLLPSTIFLPLHSTNYPLRLPLPLRRPLPLPSTSTFTSTPTSTSTSIYLRLHPLPLPLLPPPLPLPLLLALLVLVIIEALVDWSIVHLSQHLEPRCSRLGSCLFFDRCARVHICNVLRYVRHSISHGATRRTVDICCTVCAVVYCLNGYSAMQHMYATS
jgi:hypothetical protein